MNDLLHWGRRSKDCKDIFQIHAFPEVARPRNKTKRKRGNAEKMSANHWSYTKTSQTFQISASCLFICAIQQIIYSKQLCYQVGSGIAHALTKARCRASLHAAMNLFLALTKQFAPSGLAWKPSPHAAGGRGGHHCSSVFFHSSRRQQLLLNSQHNDVSAVAALFNLSTATTQHDEFQSWPLAQKLPPHTKSHT